MKEDYEGTIRRLTDFIDWGWGRADGGSGFAYQTGQGHPYVRIARLDPYDTNPPGWLGRVCYRVYGHKISTVIDDDPVEALQKSLELFVEHIGGLREVYTLLPSDLKRGEEARDALYRLCALIDEEGSDIVAESIRGALRDVQVCFSRGPGHCTLCGGRSYRAKKTNYRTIRLIACHLCNEGGGIWLCKTNSHDDKYQHVHNFDDPNEWYHIGVDDPRWCKELEKQ